MQRVRFGKTGLDVSVMGLGGGGPSKLGIRTGRTAEESKAVVHAALDGGINIFDSSESYGTEAIFGAALKDVKREDVVVCTKLHGGIDGRAKNLEEVEATVDKSLANLQTDYIDVYMLHAIGAKRYDVIAMPVLPSLIKMREKGKIRFIGITEVFNGDRGHEMLQRAVNEPAFDVIMVGFNILNTCARSRVLEKAKENDIGVFDMFAVRRALCDIEALSTYLKQQIEEERLEGNSFELVEVVRDALNSGECETLSELAYRYCLHEDGIACVLSGTGSVEHLRENIATTDKGPLRPELRASIDAITGKWDHLSAQ